MKRDSIDFFAVHDGHHAIHDQLCNWSRVVRVHVSSNRPSPMFAAYRSSEVFQAPEAKIPTDMQAGWKMERAVSNLPEKQRAAIRWQYVWPWKPPGMVARRLAVTTTVLQQLVHDGRSMLRNRT
jgi:DNA-directed RNA polymerase specialized sigma24 family protein